MDFPPERRVASPESREVYRAFQDSIRAGSCRRDELRAALKENLKDSKKGIDQTQYNLLIDLLAEKLETVSLTDPLTQVFNRRFLESTLDNIIAGLDYSGKENRKGESVMVIFIDVNKFKDFNDTHGHAVGDQALVAVAERIKKSVKTGKGDMVFRLGGDEFALLLKIPSQNSRTLDSIFEEIKNERLEGLSVEKSDGSSIPVKLSMGFATLSPGGENMTTPQLLEMADKKMYQHKKEAKSA